MARKEREAAEKRLAKKAKQKNRKIELKKIEELDELREQYEEQLEHEEAIQKSLRTLKKRKNKSRLLEAEETLRALAVDKAAILEEIRTQIRSIQELNPDFVCDLEIEEESSEESENEEEEELPPPPPPMKQQPQVRPSEVSLDPAKRMVTIRRVNIPHAEPQVTVTAKGTGPGEDKLLYTFVNGHLVPGKDKEGLFP